MTTLAAQLVGGPTALLEYAGLRWLTDPTLSPPGDYAGLTKTTGPAVAAGDLAPIDVVLLSHDHLDPAGRALLPQAGRVLTTVDGAARLGANATGMRPWTTITLDRADRHTVSITALPAQHGPDGSEPVTGPVIGFLLAADGLERVYVSGDNASLDVVRAIAEHVGPIDLAVLFAGAVQIPSRFEGAYLTLSSERAAEAAHILGVRAVILVHFEGWAHFTQGADALRAAFAGNGVSDRLFLTQPGQTVQV